MFGRSKPVVFEPYGRRRSRRRVPAWLVTAVLGIAIGVGGVIYVQERYLPPRLSAEQSVRLQGLLERAETERKRLEGVVAEQAGRLETATASERKLTDELASARRAAEVLRADVQALVEALPPDPRGGAVAIRAANFAVQDGKLAYQVILTRDAAGGKPFKGRIEIAVTGARAGAPESSVTLDPVQTSFATYDALDGALPLPEGFVPKQATVRVYEGTGDRQLGMRVLYVK